MRKAPKLGKKITKFPSLGKWWNKNCFIHAMEQYVKITYSPSCVDYKPKSNMGIL
jgi:hypothetical protein